MVGRSSRHWRQGGVWLGRWGVAQVAEGARPGNPGAAHVMGHMAIAGLIVCEIISIGSDTYSPRNEHHREKKK